MTDYFEPISFKRLDASPDDFARAIGASFRETGFAVIEDHPIPRDTIDGAIEAMKAFFGLPAETKANYDAGPIGGQRGYTAFGTENAKGNAAADQKEFWHTGRAGAAGTAMEAIMPPTPVVPDVPGFDKATWALFNALDEMGRRILSAIAIHLDLPADWFDKRVADGNSILRLLHYPPQTSPPPEGSVRAGAHEDINVVTLLLGAEEAGLQVKHRSGEWLSVNPPPGALVINVGDMLQRLTAGILPSTTHRVVNPSAERAQFPRYSTPFFLHFAPDVMIAPLESCVAEGGTAEEPISAHDYLMQRLREIGLVKV